MAVGGAAVVTRRLLERTGFSFQVSGWGWGGRVDDFLFPS
ncbi:mortality factor 4 like 2, isoform CRA_c [Rattus norvegicus]|uniref:Mortality factor 4 like 2, isoform CRA_c n=1 Tax=Rattus norvegicus TaxID=10116 RepID=A6KNT6_RAT|nr:mortality factor 4 like 2, isoform CRA_c [Rattus norvegicus]